MKINELILLAFAIQIVQSSFYMCNQNPYNAKLCISQSTTPCWFNYYENSCTDFSSNREGCSTYLSQNACLMQVTNKQQEAHCIFQGRCRELNIIEIQNLECESKVSKYGCLQLSKRPCQWKDSKCIQYELSGILEKCDQVSSQVNMNVCKLVSGEPCVNGGFENDYSCSRITDFTQYNCTSMGLNIKACLNIEKAGQNCIYLDGECQLLTSFKNIRCDNLINKNACLSLNDSGIYCIWKNDYCQQLTELNESCNSYKNVNAAVCAYNTKEKCQFYQNNCVTLRSDATCDTLGVNELGCYSFSTPCVFKDSQCQTLKIFNQFKCQDKLNQSACLQLTTRYQYCQWNKITQKCVQLTINQDTECNLTMVNGRTCQAIIKSTCKYISSTNTCVVIDSLDSCTTPFMNLYGCISVQLTNNSCKWIDEECQLIIVKRYQTKCSDLKFSNAISCSQVYYDQDVKEENCYFDNLSQGCNSFLTGDKVIGCTQSGLNEIGCTNIQKLDDVCRWTRGSCTKIKTKAELSAYPCLSLVSINPAACGLVVYNGDKCKYNSISKSCVFSVDINNDTCDTQGINSYGCASLVGKKCYYDTDKWRCIEITSSNESMLKSIECGDNTPTLGVCVSILKVGQFCQWSTQQQICQPTTIVPWNVCKDYKLVNPNVCGSVSVTNPENNSGEGYCKYNPTTYMCDVFSGACTQPCCNNEVGINTHVCSKYSDSTKYCYFSTDLKCQEATLEDYSDTYAKAFIVKNKLICAQVNYAWCNLVEWSNTQYCYQPSTTTSCVSVDFGTIKDYSIFTSSVSKVSRITCQAVTDATVYFQFDTLKKNCKFLDVKDTYPCSAQYVNINVCTRMTKDDYCQWDLNNLQCTQLSDVSTMNCSQYLNQKACLDIQNYFCMFDLKYNRCFSLTQTDVTNTMGCSYFSESFKRTVSILSCGLIIMDGQSCQYNSTNKQCKWSSTTRGSCYLKGGNKFDCFSNTTIPCKWDDTLKKCVDVPTVDVASQTCSGMVNKVICLQITSMPCVWDVNKLSCYDQPYNASTKCSDLIATNNLFSVKACTQITASGSYCHYQDQKCKETTSTVTNCTAYPFNQNSCLIKTKNTKCYFSDGECKQYTGSLDIPCNTPNISLEVCAYIEKKPCKFSSTTLTCLDQTIDETTKCSSLTGPDYFNVYACSAISVNVPINTSIGYRVCSTNFCGYEKYCFWNVATYKCSIPQLASSYTTYSYSGSGNEKISICNVKYTQFNSCSTYYSKALCLELVNNSCFFELNSGGCKSIVGRETLPTGCGSLNMYSCAQVETTGVQCKVTTGTSDSCTNPRKLTSVCSTIDASGQTCSDYSSQTVNRNVCSNLTGTCYWNGSTCASISSGAYCDLAGLSKTACQDIGSCNTSIPCKSASGGATYSQCSDANSLSGLQQLNVCVTIVMNDGDTSNSASCGYQSGSCTRLSRSMSCTELAAYQQGPDACTKYSLKNSEACLYKNYQCISVSSTQYSCANLNKFACLKYTSDVYCMWDETNLECKEITLSDVQLLTSCNIINLEGCPNVKAACWINSGLCVNSEINKSCYNVQQKSGNVLACSAITNNEPCYFDGACATLFYIDQPCTTSGMNIVSCQRMTTGLCRFNSLTNTCEASTSYDIACEGANQNLCLLITKQPCLWDIANRKCIPVSYYPIPICTIYSQTQSSYFNDITCSQIPTNPYYCAVKPGYHICETVTTATCGTVGLNKPGCLNITTEKCYFDNTIFQCKTADNMAENCTAKSFSKLACVELTNMGCKFYNYECSDFDFSLVIDSGTAIAYAYSYYLVNPIVCQKIDVDTLQFYYVSNLQKCYYPPTPPQLACNAPGLNRLACLNATNKYCYWDGTSCQSVKEAQLSSLGCSEILINWYGCISLKKAGCYFSNNSCQSVADSSTCASLVASQTNFYTCASRTDSGCSYNLSTYYCLVQTSTTLECTVYGLNERGCLQQTTTKRCIFDSTFKICSEGILDTYSCTDLLNTKNCALVSKSGQYCYFNNTKCEQQTTAQLQTCANTYIENGLSCAQSTDVACVFNSTTYKCQQAAGNEDCSTITSLNYKACISNQGPSKCKWDASISQCIVMPDTELSSQLCTNAINKLSCVNVTTNNQYCQFTTACVAKSVTDPANTCSGLSNVNRQEFCEKVTDVPCKFDETNRNCIQVTSRLDSCQRGLNQSACLSWVNSGCLFGTFCYSATDIVVCNQAQTLAQCINVKMLCQFKDGKCFEIDSTKTACLDTPPDVTPQVCYSAIAVLPLVCVYDFDNFKCKVIQPLKCSDIFDQFSCSRFSSQPCLWKNSKCIFYKVVVERDNCSDVTTIGTYRTCLDINKYGQQCYYNDSTKQCTTVPEITSCSMPINFNACVTQQSLFCKWNLTTIQVINETTPENYTFGTCANNDTLEQNCTEYLSYLTCLSITKKNQYCVFKNSVCTSIPKSLIALNAYTLVNVNVCSLVSSQPAIYNQALRICENYQSLICTTPGMNKVGCVNVSQQRCRWNDDYNTCSYEYAIKNSNCYDNNVSQLVCQSCKGKEPVKFQDGKCVKVDANTFCNDTGINQEGCLQIVSDSCIWLNDKCQSYVPYTSCLNVPKLVSPKVCTKVTTLEGCKFQDSQCILSAESDDCDTPGLNLYGCVQIKGCVFSETKGCYKATERKKCNEIGIANQSVCANALDQCKYDSISFTCKRTAFTDTCSTQGISELGCLTLLSKCEFKDSCQCSLYNSRFPDCSSLKGQSACQKDYCYFEWYTVEENGIKIQAGNCRDKVCADFPNCSGSLNQKQCYLSSNSECKAISDCTELDVEDCNKMIWNRQCIQIDGKCANLSCTSYESSTCPTQYCDLDEAKCIQKQCKNLRFIDCQLRDTECLWTGQACKVQGRCEDNTSDDTCIGQKSLGTSCSWVDKESVCVRDACRYFGPARYQCDGLSIGSETCTLLLDSSCVACEEIEDSCQCLDSQPYCDLDRFTNKCYSKNCENYSLSACPSSYCRVVNDLCQPKCDRISNQIVCAVSQECQWNTLLTSCEVTREIQVERIVILPSIKFYSLLIYVQLVIILAI